MQPTRTRDDELLKPTRAEAEEAVRTLIRWAGDDPSREGLRDTPGRVVRAYEEWFSGYAEEPAALLRRTFEEVGGYDEIVILRDIAFHSYCEHHMAPISGKVLEVNEKLESSPELINQDPHGAGWLVLLEVSDSSESEGLLDAAGYERYLSEK